jgi:hypothetical protein
MMAGYIVCPNKRNAPRVNVLVCRERCPMKEECPAYAEYVQMPLTETALSSHLETQKVVAVAS